MEELLCERRSTISYKDGKIFRKYYKYANEDDLVSEMNCSIMANESGVYCPKFIKYDYSNEKKMLYSEFEYVNILYIDRHNVSEEIIKMALAVIDSMPMIQQEKKIDNLKLVDEINFVAGFLPSGDKPKYVELGNKVLNRKSEILIHGDYSFENIGWDKDHNKLIVFDFQNSCGGICGWDKAYLMASIPNKKFYHLIPESDYELIKLIAAIKYGRGIRKGIEIEERRAIYEYWW